MYHERVELENVSCIAVAFDERVRVVRTFVCGQRSMMKIGCNSPKTWETVPALQPADVKEAIEATQGNSIARTKLRLICPVARMMFDLDLVDVGTPPVAAS